MTLEELAQLGLNMRRAQKEYFRTRSQSALEESKRCERMFDEAVADVLRHEKTRSMF